MSSPDTPATQPSHHQDTQDSDESTGGVEPARTIGEALRRAREAAGRLRGRDQRVEDAGVAQGA